VDWDQLEWALFAYHTYGRGRHPAKLNFGDCFPYALSKVTGEPLLYFGNDFAQTDLVSALAE
jgi:ribonuclease VapC